MMAEKKKEPVVIKAKPAEVSTKTGDEETADG